MSQRKVTFAEEDRSNTARPEPERKEPERLLAFGRQDEENNDNDQPANWQSHLKDLDWNANIRAMEIELNSNYNYRWWDSPTPQVSIEWPTMRKWATETLKDCLEPSGKRNQRFLTKSQQTEFLDMFKKCAKENLRFLVFKEPTSSLVENLETINNQEQFPQIHEVDDTEADIEEEQQSTTGGFQEVSSVLMDDVWSLSACNVDPAHAIRGRDDTDELDPIGEAALDWEPPELKALDFQANLDALCIAMKLPLNADWDTTQTVYIKDAALRQWASQTTVECIEKSQELTANQRQDFFNLFEEKISRTYLRSISFLNPVSILGSIEDNRTDTATEKEEEQVSDDDSESSVYI